MYVRRMRCAGARARNVARARILSCVKRRIALGDCARTRAGILNNVVSRIAATYHRASRVNHVAHRRAAAYQKQTVAR